MHRKLCPNPSFGDVSSMYNGDGKLEVPVDFERLQKGNPDIYAWITIPGVVDAPVLQHATDDTYYQNHDAGGREEKSGAVFSESLNHMDFSDSLTVLYGANTEGSSQFEGLFRYRDRQFLEEHSIVYILHRTVCCSIGYLQLTGQITGICSCVSIRELMKAMSGHLLRIF